jgi:hypothetical protein
MNGSELFASWAVVLRRRSLGHTVNPKESDMRRLILAATLALGFGAIPGAVSAAPAFASQGEAAAPSDVGLVQYRGNYGNRTYSSGPRYRNRGRAYGRYYGGPPRGYAPRGYYRRDRQWDRTW